MPVLKNNRKIGKINEDLAVAYLSKKGHTLIQQNYYCPHGEIDIITEKNDTLFIVEVKSSNTVSPQLLYKINTTKKRRLYISTIHFLENSTKHYENIQFDLILVYNQRLIEHYKNIIEKDYS